MQEILKEMPDVEQLLTLCMLTPSTVGGTQCMEKRINYVLMLKTTLEILPLLGAALENSQSTLLGKAKECLKDSRGDVMKARILETLHEDVKAPKGGKAALFQKCFAVKSGVNDLLDVARKTYSELINDIHDHVSSMGTTHSLPLKIDYSVTKGYHIQITFQKNHRIEKSTLPPFFVQVQQSRNCLTCTTDTLIHANERIKHVTSDILSISHRLLTTVLNDIRQHISYLYEMCESIAVIDLVLALAHTASCNNYVRPTFGDELSLKLSRHPILESFSTCDPVANDIEASSWKNLCIITGANMSGKSIYLRQVLLLQIMAQVGSFVPAEQAVFRLTDHIFSHLNFDDSIENNASTLSLEMQEMQFILSNITPTSIVALDELCRGTSVEEGTAIAWSLCEELNQSTAFVFVTTHFGELTKMACLYPCIKNVYLETVEHEYSDSKSRLVYTHRLLPGVNPMEHYGLRLAENMDVPKSIIQMAVNFSSEIRATTEVNFASAQGDEAYTLAFYLQKVKLLMDKEDINASELLQVQHEVTQALDLVRQQRQTVSIHQRTPPVLQEQHTNLQPRKTDRHQQNLCEYSSSELDTLKTPRENQVEPPELRLLSRDVRFGDENLSDSRPTNRFSFGRTHFNSAPEQTSFRLGSFTTSNSTDNDNEDAESVVSSSSAIGSYKEGSKHMSPTLNCSHDTWLAGSPLPSPSEKTRYSNKNLRRENSEQSISLTDSSCSSYNLDRSYHRSDLNLSGNAQNLSEPDFFSDENTFEGAERPFFGTNPPDKCLFEVGSEQKEMDFFSTKIKSSSPPFEFSQNSSRSQPKFHSLFQIAPEEKPTAHTTSPLSSDVFMKTLSVPPSPSGVKRPNVESDMSSPIFTSNKNKRKALCVSEKPKSIIQDVPDKLTTGESTQSTSFEETRKETRRCDGSDDTLSNCSQATYTEIGCHRNALQILRESYCSDSESD